MFSNMKSFIVFRSAFFICSSLLTYVFALPAPATTPKPASLHNRDLINPILSALSSVEAGVQSDIIDASQAATAYASLISAAVPTATPTAISQVISICSSIFGPTPTSQDLIKDAIELALNDLKPGDFTNNVVGGYLGGINSMNNVNLAPPRQIIYPRKSPNDAPYSVAEASLRGAIYIPPSFGYGRNGKQPVILSPGTGATGGVNFASNFIPLLSSTSFADPVWLNIPGLLLGDAQVNAEYVAYAINYLSGISSTSASSANVSIITWSQGSLDTQWAFQYWPSTRNVVSDFIGISPDFHGTVNAYILCPSFPELPCDPSIIQQEYNSNFVATLRRGGGDSAYVPTTTVYSIFDEIVQPQTGTGASGFINDARTVGVSNNEVQALCPGQPAGGFYTHEGVLYNSVAYALAVDALTHPGPGLSGRIDLAALCQQIATQGLSLGDVITTEGLIPLAAFNVELYVPKMFDEPAIKGYAT